MQVDSYVFYKSFYDGMKNMTVEDVAAANHALHAYALYGLEPKENTLSPIVQTLFVMAKPQIDANKKRRLDGEKGKKYGKLGGRPKKNPCGVLNETPNGNVYGNGKDNNISDSIESGDLPNVKSANKKNVSSKSFQKPTIAEIQAFCNEQGYSVDVQEFFDHYEANGWMAGSSKVKDWKACMRNWVRRNNKYTNAGTNKQPVSSEYTREPNADEMAF